MHHLCSFRFLGRTGASCKTACSGNKYGIYIEIKQLEVGHKVIKMKLVI